MQEQSLNGVWQYRIGQGKYTEKTVPYSVAPVGSSECVRKFDLEQKAQKYFLRFKGITYFAKVVLNGKTVGEMLPYSEYSFDITDTVKEKNNELRVYIEDISPAFGPSEGWENYGGIIRDVDIVYKNASYITDVFFVSNLKNGYKDAEFTVSVSAVANANTLATITLSKNGEEVVSYEQTVNQAPIQKTLENIALWSPETPNLYTLTVRLIENGVAVDEYTHQVGFREFACEKHRFLINGKPTFLLGVCRHDTYGECGHTLTYEQMEEDMLAIKKTGCNYVRLVHYPHDKRVLEIADKVGLFVSEEPGLWWSDTANEEIASGSLEVLRRVILRDRNHPCVAFWLCFNECHFTEKFLHDCAQLCRDTDPTRLVSGANCMSLEETKEHFNKCGFDFYTMHPYYHTVEKIQESAKFLTEMPLLFTEWGGFPVYDNPHLMADFIATMRGLWNGNDEIGYLAGASFWNWAEIHEHHRGRPACADGLLKEALIEIDRRPTLIFDVFQKEWAKLKNPPKPSDFYEFTYQGGVFEKSPLALLSSTLPIANTLETAIADGKQPIERYYYKKVRFLTQGPKLLREEVKGIMQIPALIKDGDEVIFGGGQGSYLTLLGAGSIIKGYPLGGEYGEDVLGLEIEYADGEKASLPLQNGKESTTAFTTFGPSRINPVCENGTRFAQFTHDKDHENYLINRVDIPLQNKPFTRVKLVSKNNGYSVLIYGLFI